MNKFIIALATVCAASLSGAALAQNNSGFYIGGGVSTVSTDNAEEFADAIYGSAGSADSSATALKVYGGYVWNNNFGLEAGFYDLGKYSVNVIGTEVDRFKTKAFTVSGVAALPLGQNWSLFGKLGLAFTDAKYECVQLCAGVADESKSGVVPVIGVGIGWNATKNFTVRADYEGFIDVPHTALGSPEVKYQYNVLSVSAQYRF